MAAYLAERKQERRSTRDKAAAKRLQALYKLERREEMCARVTGKTQYGSHGGRALLAYKESCYGHHKLDGAVDAAVKRTQAGVAERKKSFDAHEERIGFVRDKIAEHPAYATLFADEVQGHRSRFLDELAKYKRFTNRTLRGFNR